MNGLFWTAFAWVAVSVPSPTLWSAERSWTDKDGRVISAEFVGFNDGKITLKMQGKSYTLPLERFSTSDQTWVRAQARPVDRNGSAVEVIKRPPGSLKVFQDALAHFNLELPIREGDSVRKITTLHSQPEMNFEEYGPFLWGEGDTALVFLTPPNGGTTANSQYPRTELSQVPDERWLAGEATRRLAGTFSVRQTPKVTDKGELTLAQIHTADTTHGPLVRLVCNYEGNGLQLHAGHRLEPVKNSKIMHTNKSERFEIAPDQPIEFEITLQEDLHLEVRVRKSGTEAWHTLTDSQLPEHGLTEVWRKERCYFKIGCYLQDPGPDAEQPAIIRLHHLTVD
jgi:hypothetical protein